MTGCAVEGYSLGCSGWAGLLSRRSGSRRMGSLSVSGRGCGRRLVAGFAVGGRRAMTGARGGGAGGRSTWGPRRHLWRQTAAGRVQAARGGCRACALGEAPDDAPCEIDVASSRRPHFLHGGRPPSNVQTPRSPVRRPEEPQTAVQPLQVAHGATQEARAQRGSLGQARTTPARLGVETGRRRLMRYPCALRI